jgi:thymidylate synthase
MPVGSSWNDVNTVLAYEAVLRANGEQLTASSLGATGLAPFWQQVLLVFEAYRQIKHTDQPVKVETLTALDPGYRWLVRHRWGNRMPKETT